MGKYRDKDTPTPISEGFPKHSVFSLRSSMLRVACYQRKEKEILFYLIHPPSRN